MWKKYVYKNKFLVSCFSHTPLLYEPHGNQSISIIVIDQPAGSIITRCKSIDAIISSMAFLSTCHESWLERGNFNKSIIQVFHKFWMRWKVCRRQQLSTGSSISCRHLTIVFTNFAQLRDLKVEVSLSRDDNGETLFTRIHKLQILPQNKKNWRSRFSVILQFNSLFLFCLLRFNVLSNTFRAHSSRSVSRRTLLFWRLMLAIFSTSFRSQWVKFCWDEHFLHFNSLHMYELYALNTNKFLAPYPLDVISTSNMTLFPLFSSSLCSFKFRFFLVLILTIVWVSTPLMTQF